ncbi:LYR motif-containing protein 2 [Trichonephila clavata]|uniref:LYR motif-containing protein 2 n=1 Tax=Trichonephila clavata TaxID=2740835 RepID=A0A8X6I7C7_TRICU|nr:LYR motif-containing protein 2 [Trichonephila clavata]
MSSTSRNILTFSQFLLRSKSLKLYRDILRTIKRIPNKEYQGELKKLVREDFEQNRQQTDEEKIKYHLTRGRAFHEELITALSLVN